MAKGGHAKAIQELRDYALTFPETSEDFPWGERVIKVKRKKVFLFLSKAESEEELNLGVKLPETGAFALLEPYAKPTGYGLGKHGWVSAHFGPEDAAPIDEIKAWIEESYRAVAPKSLVAQLDGPKEAESAPAKTPRRTKKNPR